MDMNKSITAGFLLIVGLASAESAARMVPLRVDPAPDAYVVLEVDSSDPQLQRSVPAGDQATDTEPWRAVFYRGSYNGFVRPSDVGKQMQLRPGALIHVEADRGSPLLTTMEEGDEVSVVDAGDWIEIRISKGVPLFFLNVSAAIAATATPPPAAAPPPPVSRDPNTPPPFIPLEDFGSAETTIQVGPRVVDEPVQSTDSGRVQREFAPPPSAGRAYAYDSAGMDIPHTYGGILERARPSAPYTYRLITAGGSFLAFVDVTGVKSPSLYSFVGKPVTVVGVAENTARGRKIVIRALSIRL